MNEASYAIPITLNGNPAKLQHPCGHGAEKRATYKLISYWQSLKPRNGLPTNEAFKPEAIADIWQNCLHLRFSPNFYDKGYLWHHIGERIQELFEGEATEEEIKRLKNSFPPLMLLKRLENMHSIPRPMIDEGKYIDDTKSIVKFRSCLVPLSHDRHHLDGLVACVTWKRF
jgi:hypothetical protein